MDRGLFSNQELSIAKLRSSHAISAQPHLPVLPFLLVQNLSLMDIAGSDIVYNRLRNLRDTDLLCTLGK